MCLDTKMTEIQFKYVINIIYNMIKIDNRETELISLCKYYIENIPIYKNLEIITEQLPIGDVIIYKDKIEKIIIERKTVNDLLSSIKDGRYNEQSYRLNNLQLNNHNIFYLIEGNIFKKTSFNNTLYSAIFSLNYYKGFSVLQSISIEESALIICNMTYKINKSDNKEFFSEKEESYSSVIKKVKKDNITPENIGEIILCQIPGISSVNAIAIMNKFKTIKNLISNINETSDKCLIDICYVNTKGKLTKINKLVISNIIKFLKD